MKPGPREIDEMRAAFLNMLKVRSASPLFRLRTQSDVQSRVRFLETDLGPMQAPGLIAMEIRDEEAGANLDPRWKRLLVAVNVTNEALAFSHESLRARPLERLFGSAESHPTREAQLLLPPRSISVLGERP